MKIDDPFLFEGLSFFFHWFVVMVYFILLLVALFYSCNRRFCDTPFYIIYTRLSIFLAAESREFRAPLVKSVWSTVKKNNDLH